MPEILIANSNAKIKQIVKLLRDEKALGYDTETNGLDAHVGKTWSLQIGNEDFQTLIPINGRKDRFELRLLEDLFLDNRIRKVAHNGSFDLKILWSLGLDVENQWCTRIGEALLNAGLFGNNSLAYVLKRYFGVDMSKEERDDFYKDVDGGTALETGKLTKFESTGMKWTPELVSYAVGDVKYLVPLMEKQRERLTEEGMIRLADLVEMPLVKVTAAMEYRGIKINKEATLAFQKEMSELAEKTKTELVAELNERWQQHARPIYQKNFAIWSEWQARQREIISATNKMRDPANKKRISEKAKKQREAWKEVQPFKTAPKEPGVLNLRSNPQMRAALAQYGVYIKDLRKETLVEAALEHPIIEDLVEFKKLDKLAQMSEIYEKINPKTGRIHGVFNQIVDTGRYSSSAPNLQNIPARTKEGERFRSLFISEDGNILIVADYSSIELVIIGVRSGDEILLYALDADLDLHCWTMSKFLETDYEPLVTLKEAKDTKKITNGVLDAARTARTKFEKAFNLPELTKCEWDAAGMQKWVKILRDYVKTLTYGIAYGLSAFGLARRFHCDVEVAQRFIDVFFGVYRVIKQWLESQADDAIEFGYSVTTSGRRRYYRRPKPPTNEEIEEECLNVLKQQGRDFDSISPREKYDLFQETKKRMWREYKQTVNRIRRQGANHPVQGGSADMTKRAMVYFERWWVSYAKKHKINYLRFGLVLTVHDELVLEVPLAYEEIAKEKLKWAMERAAKDFLGENLKVTVKPSSTKFWKK